MIHLDRVPVNPIGNAAIGVAREFQFPNAENSVNLYDGGKIREGTAN